MRRNAAAEAVLQAKITRSQPSSHNRSTARVVIGEPIDPNEIKAREKDARALMDYLRQSTYKLSPTPLKSLDYGFEFEQKHKS
jgi:hypothetical protein